MLGVDADPLASREHVLLSTLIHRAWSAGTGLDLATLLAQVQQPPLRKLGVLDIEQVFPSADRVAFAVRLNGLLASPGFAAWMAGDPVDIGRMLVAADGRPRCAIVTTAHLSEDQRQSVTALLLAKVVTWMRRQGGTSDLRALLYMDEVAGYLPPTANPPTKKPMLTLLKQARAFGLGVVLSTQNPVDVDYKALSNAGTWLIGRLQTEQDKARLVDGLRSASGAVDITAVSATISSLGKRQFLLKRAGNDATALTTTRWAMSYLRGPLMREEIARLADLGLVTADESPGPSAPPGASPADAAVPTTPAPVDVDASGGSSELAHDETPVAPAPPSGVPVSYLDPAAPWAPAAGIGTGSRLQAAAIARVRLRYDDTKADLVHDEEYEAVLLPVSAVPALDALISVDYDDRDLLDTPAPGAVYRLPPAEVLTKTWWTALKRDLTDHLTRTRSIEILANPDLRLYSRVGESAEDFAVRCQQAAGEQADRAIAGLSRKYETRLRTARTRADSASGAAVRAQAQHDAQYGPAAQVGTLLGGIFGGRRSRTAIVTEAKRAAASGARVDAARDKAASAAETVLDLEAELREEIVALDAEWDAKARSVTTLRVPLEKSDVSVADLRLVWVPIGT